MPNPMEAENNREDRINLFVGVVAALHMCVQQKVKNHIFFSNDIRLFAS